MATVNNGLISGKVGSLVYYILNGKQMVRQKTERNIKSRKVSDNNLIFATGAKIGAGIRNSLSAQFPAGATRFISGTLNGQVYSALKNQWKENTRQFEFKEDGFRILDGFEFQAKVPVKKFFYPLTEITLDGTNLSVAFHEIHTPDDLMFPGESLKCDVVVSLTAIKVNNELTVSSFAKNQLISIKKIEGMVPPTTMTFVAPPESLCIVTMFLRFYIAGKDEWKLINSSTLNPGKILKATYTSAERLPEKSRRWIL